MIKGLKDSISENNWRHLYNPHVLHVLLKSVEYEGSTLWGITGDLDSLGVYVAENGRSKAENLVDYYNQIIRNYIDDWFTGTSSKEDSVCFIPCGEEVLILGVSKNTEAVKSLFTKIKRDIDSQVNEQNYIKSEPTGASFGCSILKEKSLSKDIDKLSEEYKKSHEDDKVFPPYLKILENIRSILSIELDKVKFSDILKGEYPVEMRQLVLSRMLLYKYGTQEIVSSMNTISSKDSEILISSLGGDYGLNLQKAQEIDNKIVEILK